MAGNTSVFNAPAEAILRRCAGPAKDRGIESHDWWAYQVTAGAGAALIHDETPALLYRQHPRSEMGRNDTLRAKWLRAGKLLAGEYGGWLAANHAALDAVRAELLPENRAILDRFGQALRQPGPLAAATLARIGLYRQTPEGTAALLSAALLGRLRQSAPTKPIR